MRTNSATANQESRATVAPRVVPVSGDRQLLQNALNKWRVRVLAWLADEMCKGADKYRRASEGLEVAYRNPGEVADDVIQILWDQINEASDLLCRLEHVSTSIQEMGLPELIILFQRSNKAKSWPWEGERWNLALSTF